MSHGSYHSENPQSAKRGLKCWQKSELYSGLLSLNNSIYKSSVLQNLKTLPSFSLRENTLGVNFFLPHEHNCSSMNPNKNLCGPYTDYYVDFIFS